MAQPKGSRDTWAETHVIGSKYPNSLSGATGPTGDELFGYDGVTNDYLSKQPSNLNPLLPTYFQFQMARCPNVTYFCQSANLPSISATPVPQPTRFVDVPHSPGIPEYDELNITFIVDEDLNNWLEIHDWIRSTVSTKDHLDYMDSPEHYSDASISILNSAMQPKIRVQFYNLLPTNLGGLEFDSSSASPDALIGSASFRFTSYEITKL